MSSWALLVTLTLFFYHTIVSSHAKTCTLLPLGHGRDDTDQVEKAIKDCGQFGTTIFEPGTFNITRKMTWNLVSSHVDLRGFLSFHPDIQFWLNPGNTYRVVFIQNQASWFVITGSDFIIDAHNVGGIQANGQPWWTFFESHTRGDGDGRPISLTLWRATRGIIKNFRIISPPFWSNTVAESSEIVYDGMFINATNTDPQFFGINAVPNTDGINTFRSNRISMLNWDVTCGDDCLAIKGNSSNILARNITCRGGNGIGFGSLGQYANLSDIVSNVLLEDLSIMRIDPKTQPNMGNGVYFKTWTGTINGSPPSGGGGGTGSVNNVVVKGVHVDLVDIPLRVFQTKHGHDGDAPSTLKFNNLSFFDWTGTSRTPIIVAFQCSPAAGCNGISFSRFNVTAPVGVPTIYACQNVQRLSGLMAPCNETGQA